AAVSRRQRCHYRQPGPSGRPRNAGPRGPAARRAPRRGRGPRLPLRVTARKNQTPAPPTRPLDKYGASEAPAGRGAGHDCATPATVLPTAWRGSGGTSPQLGWGPYSLPASPACNLVLIPIRLLLNYLLKKQMVAAATSESSVERLLPRS
nr:hypothetical protein [Tanacetum cinerariifolium]